MHIRTWLPAMALTSFAALAVACGADPTPTGTTSASIGQPSEGEVLPILGTTVLRVGTQRVAFLLEGATALITEPTVGVSTSHASGEASTENKRAVFHKWPFGTRGAYVTELAFDQPGVWRLDIIVGEGEQAKTAQLMLDVQGSVEVRDIGMMAPFSVTKTLAGVGGDFEKLSSHQRPDPDLYELSVAQSLLNGKPGVIAFASPAFCTSPTCGPQVDTPVELKNLHRGEADFIHLEIYDNPEEIQGDLTKGVLSPVLAEWGIDSIPDYRNESWTFVLDRNGRVTARFEGFATLDELEAALAEVL